MNKKTVALMTGTAIIGALGTFFATLPPEEVQSAGLGVGVGMIGMGSKDMEKCYGIVKAGKNDCSDKAGVHNCSGKATKDADPNEYLLVPKGMCAKIVGGNSD